MVDRLQPEGREVKGDTLSDILGIAAPILAALSAIFLIGAHRVELAHMSWLDALGRHALGTLVAGLGFPAAGLAMVRARTRFRIAVFVITLLELLYSVGLIVYVRSGF